MDIPLSTRLNVVSNLGDINSVTGEVLFHMIDFDCVSVTLTFLLGSSLNASTN